MTPDRDEQLTELFRQAVAAAQQADWERTGNLCRKILGSAPDQPDTCYLLGIASQNSGDITAALSAYGKVLPPHRYCADALNNMGTLHEAGGNTATAIDCYRQATATNPAHFQANYNLGRSARLCGDIQTAEQALRAALALQGNSVAVLLELASLLRHKGDLHEALTLASQAGKLQPGDPVICNLLGNIHQSRGELSAATDLYRQALRARPDYAEACNNLGSACIAMGDVAAALRHYGQAAELAPDWHGAVSNLLLAGNYLTCDQRHQHALHSSWGATFGTPDPDFRRIAGTGTAQKIRIGYVSPDLRAHSVAWFLLSILRNHDRHRFHITCFSDTVCPDAVTGEIADLADGIEVITGLPDQAVLDRVRRSRMDILVDLTGHTANNRLAVFARQAAPVQVSYLGYPNTTGISAIRYRITDRLADPPGDSDRFYSETLIRMPACFVCYSPVPEAPPCSGPAHQTNGCITFGSFNVLAKISDACLDTWCRILHRVEGSKLLLKSAGLEDASTRSRLAYRCREHGIDMARLLFLPRAGDMGAHLRNYSGMDIALDTFPYNGTTTTCESLWMGVPVVSLASPCHAGRVGRTLLATTGCPELCADDRETYIEIAASLAADRTRLQGYHADLRQRMLDSPLCDGRTFTRSLESAYLEMLKQHAPYAG